MTILPTIILIVLMSGGHGANAGASGFSQAFYGMEACQEAQQMIIKQKSVDRITALCVEKKVK